MSCFLVTGGAGFIGSHLVEKLTGLGHKVIVLDDFSTGMQENLSQCRADMVEVIEGDVRDARLLENLAPKVAGIFHLAALVSVPRSIEDPGLSFDINARGTQMILDAARKAGGKKVVTASSAAVYGDNEHMPLSEDAELAPLSPYGLDKLIGERLGTMYASLYGMDVTALRFFNVFGPRQDPASPYSGVVSIFIDRLIRREAPTIYADGEQTRDFIYVTDVAHALASSMTSPLQGFRVYNVARGQGISVNRIWDVLCSGASCSVPPRYATARVGDIRFSTADISRIRKDLNFEAATDIEGGLRHTYDWARARVD